MTQLRRALDRPGGRGHRAGHRTRATRRAGGRPSSCRVDGRPLARHRSARRPDRLAVTARSAGPAPPSGGRAVGVGPWAGPWPDDPRYDPELLADGDRRNVVDRYRYWTVEAIVADLDRRRHPFHVAIENFGHDLNIGTRRPHGQRLPRRRGAHRRPAPLEPARARWSPTGTSTCATTPTSPRCWPSPRRRGCPSSPSTTAPAPCRSRPPSCPSGACCCSARRARG